MVSTLDRVFNSTISLPQQLLWRIQRALKDDEIDLFSEKGILDASLLPVIGMLDDHRHDVMPKDLFGPSLGKQIGGSVLTDPLFYMSGGLTGIAQAARYANLASRTGAMKTALATGKAAGKWKDVGSMTGKQFKDTLDEVIGTGLNAAGKAIGKKELKTLKKAQKGLGKQGKDIDGMQWTDILKQHKQRQLAVQIPLLSRVTGWKWNMAPEHQGWFQLLNQKGKDAGRVISTVMPFDLSVAKVPWIGKHLDATAGVYRNLKRGWAVGNEARYALQESTDVGNLSMAAATQRKSTGRILDKVTAGGGLDEIVSRFAGLTSGKKALPPLQALRRVLKGRGGEAKGEEFWRTITGKDDGVELTATSLRAELEGLNARYAKARQVLDDGATTPVLTKAGEVMEVAEREMAGYLRMTDNEKQLFDDIGDATQIKEDKYLEVMKAAQAKTFAAGKFWRKSMEKMFRTDTGIGSMLESDRHLRMMENMGADQVKAVTELMYGEMVPAIAKARGIDESTVISMLGHALEASPHPDELLMSVKHAMRGGEAAEASLRATAQFGERISSTLTSLRELLKAQGVSSPQLRELEETISRDLIDQLPKRSDELLVSLSHSLNATKESRVVFSDAWVAQPANRYRISSAQAGNKSRRIGELSDRMLHQLIRKHKATATRPMSDSEVLKELENTPDYIKFMQKEGLTHNEMRQVLARKGGAATRKVRRDFKPRFAKVKEIKSGLNEWSVKTPTGDSVLVKEYKVARKAKDGASGKFHVRVGKHSKAFKTKAEARAFVKQKYSVDKSVDAFHLDQLKKANPRLASLVSGKATTYHPASLPKNAQRDLQKAEDLLGLREKGIAKYEKGKRSTVVTSYPEAPSVLEAVYKNVNETKDLNKFGEAYVKTVALTQAMQTWLKNHPDDLTKVPPKWLMEQLTETTGTAGRIIKDTVMEGLGDEGRDLFDMLRTVQGGILKEAARSGVHVPGSPLAYVPLYFSAENRKALDALIGEIPFDVKMVLSGKQASMFGRKDWSNRLSVDELNELHLTAKAGATPESQAWANKLQKILKSQGISGDRYESDPILRFMSRLGEANQSKTIRDYVGNLLNSQDPSKASMMGGKVVGYFDDRGQKVLLSRKAPMGEVLEKGDAIKVAEGTEELEDTVRGLIVKNQTTRKEFVERNAQ